MSDINFNHPLYDYATVPTTYDYDYVIAPARSTPYSISLNGDDLKKYLEIAAHQIEAAEASERPNIIKTIFNNPATIVKWSDGTKTVVKCGEHDTYDPEKGLAMAVTKKYFGNEGNYYEIFKKWLPKEDGDAAPNENKTQTKKCKKSGECAKCAGHEKDQKSDPVLNRDQVKALLGLMF